MLLYNSIHHLQVNLKKALLDQNVEYRGAFLTTLVEVMTPEEESFALSPPCPPRFEETWLQECVEVLFTDLESDRGGPVLISTALCAVSLLLSQRYTHMSCTLMLICLAWCYLIFLMMFFIFFSVQYFLSVNIKSKLIQFTFHTTFLVLLSMIHFVISKKKIFIFVIFHQNVIAYFAYETTFLLGRGNNVD